MNVTLAGVCVLSISQHSEGHDHLWCYRHEEEKRPLQRACIGVAESAACTFDSDGYARTGICVDKDDTGISRCEGKPGPGAPSLPPADLRGPAVTACTDKALKESCYFSGNLSQGPSSKYGVCVGTGTLWCYMAGYEKRPSQRACMGKAMEGDACGFDPDGIVRFGTCVARAGGMLRCQPPEDWDLCLPPVEPTPPPPVTPKPTIDPTTTTPTPVDPVTPPPHDGVVPRCSACINKVKRDPCTFVHSSGGTHLPGVCVLSISQHSEGHDHLWCYRHEEEKRPLQKACIGVAESAACTFDSDGYARTGICVDKDGYART